MQKLEITEQIIELTEKNNRIDVIDGLKLFSYMFATIATLETYAPRGFQKELFTAFQVV